MAPRAVRPGARPVVAVVAQVGGDEAEARRGALAVQVVGQVARWRTGCRWRPACPSGTTLALHSAVLSITEWNQTKGLCRVVYWSAGVATSAVSVAPMAGWPQSVPPRRVGRAAVARGRVAHVLLVGAPCRHVGRLVRRDTWRRAGRRSSARRPGRRSPARPPGPGSSDVVRRRACPASRWRRRTRCLRSRPGCPGWAPAPRPGRRSCRG